MPGAPAQRVEVLKKGEFWRRALVIPHSWVPHQSIVKKSVTAGISLLAFASGVFARGDEGSSATKEARKVILAL